MTREEAIKEIKSWDFLEGKEIEAIHTLIPELAESVEDERIREELVEYHKQQFENNRDQEVGLFHKDALAWLEKRKDASKAIEAVDRIDKYIDEHLANAHDMKDSNPDKKYYRGWDDALGKMAGILQDVYSGEKQEEQKPVDYEHEMWKNCEANFEGGKKEVIEHPEKYGLQKPAEWSEEDKEMLECVIMDVESAKENYLKSTTEVVRQGAIIADKELAWLKALRPSWKPTEEEMKALKECGECKRCIKKLYEDLQKRYGTC